MKSFTPELKKILHAAGCRLIRQGKGDHEIWESPTGRRFVVDNAILSRHLANTVLNRPDCPSNFDPAPILAKALVNAGGKPCRASTWFCHWVRPVKHRPRKNAASRLPSHPPLTTAMSLAAAHWVMSCRVSAVAIKSGNWSGVHPNTGQPKAAISLAWMAS